MKTIAVKNNIMNKYRLRVFPGKSIYNDYVTSQHYYIDTACRINFYNLIDDERIIIASYPSAVVIIESIEYDIEN